MSSVPCCAVVSFSPISPAHGLPSAHFTLRTSSLPSIACLEMQMTRDNLGEGEEKDHQSSKGGRVWCEGDRACSVNVVNIFLFFSLWWHFQTPDVGETRLFLSAQPAEEEEEEREDQGSPRTRKEERETEAKKKKKKCSLSVTLSGIFGLVYFGNWVLLGRSEARF